MLDRDFNNKIYPLLKKKCLGIKCMFFVSLDLVGYEPVDDCAIWITARSLAEQIKILRD